MKLNFYHGVIAVLILVLLTREGCNCMALKQKEKQIAECKGSETVRTVIKTDTVTIKEAVNVPVYVPQPYRVENRGFGIEFEPAPYHLLDLDTSGVIHWPPKVDTAAILRDYYAYAYYLDSVSTKYGKVFISDTLTRNRIATRSVNTAFEIPVVTNTVEVEKPAKNQVYFGIMAQGNKLDFFSAFGASIMFKTKRSTAFELGALYGKNNVLTYQAGIKFLIKLKK